LHPAMASETTASATNTLFFTFILLS